MDDAFVRSWAHDADFSSSKSWSRDDFLSLASNSNYVAYAFIQSSPVSCISVGRQLRRADHRGVVHRGLVARAVACN